MEKIASKMAPWLVLASLMAGQTLFARSASAQQALTPSSPPASNTLKRAADLIPQLKSHGVSADKLVGIINAFLGKPGDATQNFRDNLSKFVIPSDVSDLGINMAKGLGSQPPDNNSTGAWEKRQQDAALAVCTLVQAGFKTYPAGDINKAIQDLPIERQYRFLDAAVRYNVGPIVKALLDAKVYERYQETIDPDSRRNPSDPGSDARWMMYDALTNRAYHAAALLVQHFGQQWADEFFKSYVNEFPGVQGAMAMALIHPGCGVEPIKLLGEPTTPDVPLTERKDLKFVPK